MENLQRFRNRKYNHNSKTADQAQRFALQAAIGAGLAAYQAGQDVRSALEIAGYSAATVGQALNYIRESYTSQAPSEIGVDDDMSPAGTASSGRSRKRVKTAPVAKNVKKYVNKCMDRLVDDKYTTLAINHSSISTSGTVAGLMLPGILQGLTDSARIGNVIRVKQIVFRGWIADSVSNRFRFLAFWDRQSNGAAPTFGQLISAPNPDGPFNNDEVVGYGGSRLSVMYDRRFFIEPKVTGQINYHPIYFKKDVNTVVRYDASTGAITDMVGNNLCYGYIASSTTATTSLIGTWQIMYNDA